MALQSFSQFREKWEKDKDSRNDGLTSFSDFKKKKKEPKIEYRPLADPGEPTVDEILRTVQEGQREEEERLDLTDRDLTISAGEKQTTSDRISSRLFSPISEILDKKQERLNPIRETIERNIRKIPGGDEVIGFRDELQGAFSRVLTGEEQSGTNITPQDQGFRSSGVLGLLSGKTKTEQYIDRFNKVLETGVSEEVADEIAQKDIDIMSQDSGPYNLNHIVARQELYDSLPDDQAKALKSVRFWENFNVAMNAADIASFGVGGTLGRLGKEATERVARSTSADEIADILRGEFSNVGQVTDDVINPIADILRYINDPNDVEKVFNRVRFQAQGVKEAGSEVVEREAAQQGADTPILNNPPEPDEVTGFQFVSPNIEEGMDFSGARRALTSERHARMADIIHNVDATSRLATRQSSAIGDWADGAEDTFYIEETGGASLDQLRVNAAEKGILTNQKAVISFKVGDGDDAVYTVDVDTTDMEKIRDDLTEAGLQFRTLLEQADNTRIAIFDQGDQLADEVNNFSSKYETPAKKYKGSGEFIGGETRTEGLREYRRIIEEARMDSGGGRRRDGDSVHRGEEGRIEDPQRLLPGEQAVQGDNFFMSSAQNNRWGPEARMRAEQRSIKRAKEKKALEARNDRVRTAKEVLDNRRRYVSDLRDRFGLSDSELRKISNNRDIRLMGNYEFKKFIDDMRQRAVELADTRQAKNELMDFMNRMDFQRVDNYRRVKGYPPITRMNAEQLRDYLETLENYAPEDSFLTQRQLELVDRNDTLKGIRTEREAKERFAEEYKRLTGKDIKPDDMNNISTGWFDRFKGDATLARSNPFFEVTVKKVHSHLLAGETRYLEIEKKANDLARKANKSRDRGVLEKGRQALIPKHEEIINYLEAAPEDKAVFRESLTDAEVDYANYIERYYSSFYDHLVKQRELGTSRFVDQYFTHTRKKFLESLSDDGIVDAFRTMWNQHKDDRMVAQIIDDDTGNILSKSKFFANTLHRSGEINPSQNVTRVFLNYVKMAERKKALDQLIIETDIYTQAMSPKATTKNGLEVDRSLKNFMNEWLNNKKGRRSSIGGVLPQNSPQDIFLRQGNTFVSLRDLGLNIPSSVVAVVGEQWATLQSLGKIKYVKAWKRRLWDTGIKRLGTKGGSNILKNSKSFIGRDVLWGELLDPDKQIGDRLREGIYSIFSQSSVEANKIFVLGSATKAEMKAGKLSAERMAEMRLDAARWRDMGSEIKSIIGSTSFGEVMTKYLGWAIPMFNTSMRNLGTLAKDLAVKGVAGRGGAGRIRGSAQALTSREAKETYDLISNIAIAFMIGDYIFSEEKDESFAGQLSSKLRREMNTLMQGINPVTFLTVPRLLTFIADLVKNLVTLIKLEEYKTNTRWGDKGDLKGLKGLQRQFRPSALDQLGIGGESSGAGGEGLNIDGESLDIRGDSLNIDGGSLEI